MKVEFSILFHSEAKVPLPMQDKKGSSVCLKIDNPHTFHIPILIMMCSWALCGCRLWSTFETSQFVKLMSECNWSAFVDEF